LVAQHTQLKQEAILVNTSLSFEDAWCRLVNGPSDGTQEQLLACLDAAVSLEEMRQVFNAVSHFPGTNGVRPAVLKKMLEGVKTREEAEQVYKLANKRRPGGIRVFPALVKLARAKLESFKQPA
jgi:hypothetical protein